MVKHEDALDCTFAALSDPTRRALLARLAQQDELSVSALAAPLAMSLPAVMKHLDVLAGAGLVTRTKTGRTVACRLAAGPMEDAMHRLARYRRYWSEQLDRLAAFVEETPCQPMPAPPPDPVSPSGGALPRASRKLTRRGRSRSS